MRVEIYGLSDPRDGRVRYVGKANDSSKRLASHIRDARRRRTPVYDWINSLEQSPSIQILAVCEQAHWPDVERQIIAQWRLLEPKLLNLADGGDEPHCPLATRIENGRKSKGRLHNDPVNRLVWEVKMKFAWMMRSKHISAQALEKLRQCKDAVWSDPLKFAPTILGKERCDTFCADIENRLSQCHS